MTDVENVKEQKNKLISSEIKIDKNIVDLKSKSFQQLQEILERQMKILQNRHLVMKLPDKGKKIFAFKTIVENEIKRRNEECQETCKLFENLTINDLSLEEIEWNNGSKISTAKIKHDYGRENNSELDVLKLMANHSGTITKKNGEINMCKLTSGKKIYSEKFCDKFEKLSKNKLRFKPNQLKDNDKQIFKISAEKVKERLGDRWEVTEATPPVPIFVDSVLITLSESLKLQKDQIQKSQDVEKKNASERLIQNSCWEKNYDCSINNINQYRNTKIDLNDTSSDEEENEDSYTEI